MKFQNIFQSDIAVIDWFSYSTSYFNHNNALFWKKIEASKQSRMYYEWLFDKQSGMDKAHMRYIW